MMIKGNLTMALDGDFRKAQPQPEVYSYRGDDGKWRVVECGPRYSNQYEVAEFDADGEKWLVKNDRSKNGSAASLSEQG